MRNVLNKEPKESGTLFSNLNRLRPLFSRRDKKCYLLLVFMMLVGAVLETLGIGMIPALITLLTNPEKYASLPILKHIVPAGQEGPTSQLAAWCVVLMLIFFTSKIFFFSYYLQLRNRLIARHQIELTRRIFSAYINASWEFHLGKNSAELQRNVIGETIQIFSGIITPLLAISLGVSITLLIIATNIVFLPWTLFIFLIFFCFLSGVALHTFKNSLTQAGETARNARKSSIQSVMEGLSTLLEARILGKESFLISRLTDNVGQFAHADRKRDYISKLFPHILETLAILGLVSILWLLLKSGNDLMEALPVFSLVVASLVRLRQSMAAVMGSLGLMHYSKHAIRNITDHLTALEGQQVKPRKHLDGSPPPPRFREQIQLENISYSYPETDTPSIQELDLTIPYGEIACLTGCSGSGKSTAINLILGILQPKTGRVLVDGVSIHDDLRSWHEQIGYVPQTIHLLDASLRSNVAFGVEEEDIDDDQLLVAIQLAQLEAFVKQQPDGMLTLIGEGGAKMSGGQRQRLGLARALYRRPQLLILDEGTSALDNATEGTILQQLKRHEWPVTIIMISHREASIRFSSRIFLFQHGRVVASGDHKTLMNSSPEYVSILQE